MVSKNESLWLASGQQGENQAKIHNLAVEFTRVEIGDAKGTTPILDPNLTQLINKVQDGELVSHELDTSDGNQRIINMRMPPTNNYDAVEILLYAKYGDIEFPHTYFRLAKPFSVRTIENGGSQANIKYTIRVSQYTDFTVSVIPDLAFVTRKELETQTYSKTEQDSAAIKNRIVGGNLLRDPWLFNVEKVDVDGTEVLEPQTPPFAPEINTQMTVVSSKSLGFCTRYGHSNVQEAEANTPEDFTDDPWLATPEKPLFSKWCNSNKVIVHSGGFIGGDWNNLKPTGHIIKLEVPASSDRHKYNDSDRGHNGLRLENGQNRAIHSGSFLLRAWIHVAQGSLVFGDHSGYGGSYGKVIYQGKASDFSKDNSDHPFKLIEFDFKSERGGNSINQFRFASGDNDSPLIAYIASAQLFALDSAVDKEKPMTGECFGGLYV